MEEVRDIFRRHLIKAEREVRRRYQASDASLNMLEDFSRVSDWALTRRLERPSEKYQHDYVQSVLIVKREANRIRKILVRETRPRTTLHNKWKTITRRSTGGSASLYEAIFMPFFSYVFGPISRPSKMAFSCLSQAKNYTHQALATLMIQSHHFLEFLFLRFSSRQKYEKRRNKNPRKW